MYTKRRGKRKQLDKVVEVNFLDIEENKQYVEEIEKVIMVCFKEENLIGKNLYINVVLTNPQNIRKINKKHRNIDSETDVLSFPMFEKEELESINLEHLEVLGDIVISIDQVKKQGEEFGHGFEREFAYMLVHGFYHILGFDHIEEEDKKIMRRQEEKILNKLNITR